MYPRTALALVPSDARRAFLDKGEQQVHVHPRISRRCIFRRLNLVARSWPFAQPFHVIFLRNVLYYFSPELRQQVIEACYDVAASVDVFFASLARAAGPLAAACLLTGMGRDGAEGLALMRRAGARTFAQDQASSPVWGMPHAAYELGAAEALVPLERVPEVLLQALGTQARSLLPTRHPEPAAAVSDEPPSLGNRAVTNRSFDTGGGVA